MARDEDVQPAASTPAEAAAYPAQPAEDPAELAERIRAVGSGQPTPATDRLPAVRRATVVRRDGAYEGRSDRLPLPVVVRRVALATRESLRNPAVAASVTALVTVAAQVGLRMLDQRARGRSAARLPVRPTAVTAPPAVSSVPPAGGWVRITETRSVTVQQLRQYL